MSGGAASFAPGPPVDERLTAQEGSLLSQAIFDRIDYFMQVAEDLSP